MYYAYTFESFVFTYASYNLLTLGERARMYITVHAVTTYIPNVGLSLRYNFHAIRVLSATSRNSQTTYNHPKPPSFPARISGAERAFEGGDEGYERERESEEGGDRKRGKKKQRRRQSRVRESEAIERKNTRDGFKAGKGEKFSP